MGFNSGFKGLIMIVFDNEWISVPVLRNSV